MSKGLEEIKSLSDYKKLQETKSKKELAWEIAVKKNVDMFALKHCIKHNGTVNDYNSEILKDDYITSPMALPLTEEEFELLKSEVGE